MGDLFGSTLLMHQGTLLIMLISWRVNLVSVNLHGVHNNKVEIKSHFSLIEPLSDPLKEVDVRNIFHCDGLLLCTTKDKRLVVWNPCLREHKWIHPRSSYRKFDIYALGKSSCNKYKILRMDEAANIVPVLFEYEIYDFTSNSWRVVGKASNWFIPRWKSRGMSVNGNTYWVASTDQKMTSGDFLLCFDFSTERFASISLPDPGDHLSYHLIALSVTRENQKLCLLATRGMQVNDIDVWIATKIECTGASIWSKFTSADLANPYKPFCFAGGMNFLVDQENKVLVCPGKQWVFDIFLHVVGEDKFIQVDHHDAESRCSLVVSYVPTLVQIQVSNNGYE